MRTLAVCCADFPAFVAASGVPGQPPLAVVAANRVVSLTARARGEGVRVGQTRREAQARCPSLHVVPPDPARDARVFERVMRTLEEVAPRWEVGEAGRCAVPVRGPSRFFGGDIAVARRVSDLVEATLAEISDSSTGDLGGVGVAVADGPRAAAVLAEMATRSRGQGDGIGWGGGAGTGSEGAGIVVVPVGETAERLAGLAVGALGAGGAGWGDPAATGDLIDVLGRLGLVTLGMFASLEVSDVLARFARTGVDAHNFARASEQDLAVLGELPLDVSVSAEIDPPAETVDRVGFVARSLATEMHLVLAERGLLCTRVVVLAETTTGERIERTWRDEGTLSATAVAQRVRWQLEGWLQARGEGEVRRLELAPEHLIADGGTQLELWSTTTGPPRRTREGLARLVAMLGPESVLVPRPGGGRSVAEGHTKEPCDPSPGAHPGQEHAGSDLAGSPPGPVAPPWPGSIPAPSPTMLLIEASPVELHDLEGRPVGVDGRGVLSGQPCRCRPQGRDWSDVQAWAGPWCIDERWWDPLRHRRRARMQVLLESGAHLITLESGRWRLEATYD